MMTHPGVAGAPTGVLGSRYELLERIGQGGMGEVYRARDLLLRRDVAVKLLDVLEGDIVAEARAAASLQHPGIASVFDAGREDGRAFLVMELVPGPTLNLVLQERGTLPSKEARAIAARVADALDAAHRRGIVHCDVKPQNIILPPSGGAKLVDFGIARAANRTQTLDGSEVRGSVAYVAPEQVRGHRVDGRTDVYALGAVLYEMLTGQPPFAGGNVAAIATRRLVADPPGPRTLNPAIPPRLERTVIKALAREPAERYATAGAFRDALQAADGEGTVVARAAPPVGTGGGRARRSPLLRAAALAVLVGMASGALAFSVRSRLDGPPAPSPAATSVPTRALPMLPITATPPRIAPTPARAPVREKGPAVRQEQPEKQSVDRDDETD